MNQIRTLLVSANYPNEFFHWTPWNRAANIAISKMDNVKTEVVTPLPFSLPFKFFPYSNLTKLPLIECCEEGKIHRPRFLYMLPQKLFYSVIGEFYKQSIPKYVLNNLSKHDIVHSHQSYPDGYGMIDLCEKWSVPLVIDIHSSDSVLTWLNHPSVNTKFMETLNYSSKIICISDSLRDMIKDLGINDEKIESVPMGVDTNKFKPRDKDRIKEEFKIKEKKIILFVGLLIERKGVNYLLESISLLETSYKEDFKIIIIGDGPEKSKLLNLSNKLNLKDKISFLGEVRGDELLKWYSIADIFVLPSLAEGRPIAIYEAMASECAVIATNVDGVPEQIKDGYNGFLVNSKDSIALSKRIKILLENEDLMVEMGKNSRKRLIEEEWTWNGYAKRIIEVYNRVV